MAIPITKYIDIASKTVQGSVGRLDFSGLVFTGDAINTGSSLKSDYDNGEVIAFTKDGIAANFASTTDIYKFAMAYFGYDGGNSTPTILNVVKVLAADTTANAAYTRVTATKGFTNFGAFTFLGSYAAWSSTSGGMLDVAKVNASSKNVFIMSLTSGEVDTAGSYLHDLAMAHIVVAADATDKKTAAYMPMAWYASVDYTKKNASDTIDYKQFAGATASVTTGSVKDNYDGMNINYIGLVQVNGSDLKFYQTGVNNDGIDTGVVRDRVWMQNKIETGWFDLCAASKVPANYAGAAMVKAMILDVCTQAVANGCILVDKELDSTQTALIATYTGSDEAASIVQSNGYYISTEIVKSGTRYVCQYTLVYAKGDHIGKVTGTNYLV